MGDTDLHQRVIPARTNQNRGKFWKRGPWCHRELVRGASELAGAGWLGESFLDPT